MKKYLVIDDKWRREYESEREQNRGRKTFSCQVWSKSYRLLTVSVSVTLEVVASLSTHASHKGMAQFASVKSMEQSVYMNYQLHPRAYLFQLLRICVA